MTSTHPFQNPQARARPGPIEIAYTIISQSDAMKAPRSWKFFSATVNPSNENQVMGVTGDGKM